MTRFHPRHSSLAIRKAETMNKQKKKKNIRALGNRNALLTKSLEVCDSVVGMKFGLSGHLLPVRFTISLMIVIRLYSNCPT